MQFGKFQCVWNASTTCFSILLRYQESKIKKKFFIFRLLMKLIFQMKRKRICLLISQKTMASQIMRVILIQHPRKDHFRRNLKNRRKMKRWTKRCKWYRKGTIRSRRIHLIYLVGILLMKSDHWIIQILNVEWSLKYKKFFFNPNSTFTFRHKSEADLGLLQHPRWNAL